MKLASALTPYLKQLLIMFTNEYEILRCVGLRKSQKFRSNLFANCKPWVLGYGIVVLSLSGWGLTFGRNSPQIGPLIASLGILPTLAIGFYFAPTTFTFSDAHMIIKHPCRGVQMIPLSHQGPGPKIKSTRSGCVLVNWPSYDIYFFAKPIVSKYSNDLVGSKNSNHRSTAEKPTVDDR